MITGTPEIFVLMMKKEIKKKKMNCDFLINHRATMGKLNEVQWIDEVFPS